MAKSAANRQYHQRVSLKSNKENYNKCWEDRNQKKKARDTQKEQMSPTKWNKDFIEETNRFKVTTKKLK